MESRGNRIGRGMGGESRAGGVRRVHEVARGVAMLALAAIASAAVAGAAMAEDAAQATGLWDAIVSGKPTVNVRGRIELAKVTGLERSEAYTLRTRIGYGTKPFHGVRVYTNFENIATPTTSTFFDPTNPPNAGGQTPIVDPPGTEVNEGFLEIVRPDWLGSQLKGGREAIVYDDARFIGDVAWRQNQQTFDGIEVRTSLGLEGLSAKYAWIGHVNRIFGGGGSNPDLRDFESNSQLIHIGYDGVPHAKLVAFAYLLDLENDQSTGDPDGASSQSYGFRATGDFGLTEKLSLDYVASYAWQANYGDKAVDYSANYVDAGFGLRWAGLGRVAAGFELLGSDDGVQQFSTPLATAHKFNGWADVYLNNGGVTGLRDLRASVAPALPWKLAGELVYHRFWDDESGALRGNEIDGMLKRPFGSYLTVLAKGAYFNSATDAFAEDDTWRFWFDIEVKF